MKNLKSILCASLLTLAMCSASFARVGDITSKPGDITSKPGDITSLTDEAYNALMGILNSILG